MRSVKEEFLEILRSYQGILHKVNLVYFRNQADREDNFQEIVYQLWKSYPALQNKQSLGSWIYAVSINTSLMRIRNLSRIEYREQLPDTIDKTDFLEQLSANQQISILLKAIYKLNEIDKSIMLLYLEEKSYAEIAGILGISLSNVGVRINRAKEIIKLNVKNS